MSTYADFQQESMEVPTATTPARGSTDMNKVPFSVFRNSAGLMAKRISLLPDGMLTKTPAALMTRGTVETACLNLVELPALLAALKSNEAIGIGVCDRAPAPIVTKDEQPKHPDAVARTLEFFKMPSVRSLGFMDCDTGATPVVLLAALAQAFPAFDDAAKVILFLSSAGIHRTGEDKPISESKGIHLYFTLKAGDDFMRFGSAICKRLWLAGHSHIEVGNAGQLLTRQLRRR